MATGWTWDYVRHNMTFKRYEALKRQWRELPPLPVTALAIAKSLGMELEAPERVAKARVQEEVFYDESYYENTAATPWEAGGGKQLANDFSAVGGEAR